MLLFQKHLKMCQWSTARLSRLIGDVSNFLKILVSQWHPPFLKNVGHPPFLKCGLAPGLYLMRWHPLQSPIPNNSLQSSQYPWLPLQHVPWLPLRTFHYPANPLYSIILSHSFSTPDFLDFSSHVLQPSHIHHSRLHSGIARKWGEGGTTWIFPLLPCISNYTHIK